jgi:ribosomal protein S18 acetylase RimI-like enzyme
MEIRTYESGDEDAVVALWKECGLTRPWNDPREDIRRKLTEQPELFLIAVVDERLVATVMAGFDGHRGWVYYLAVSPDQRGKSVGRALMDTVERLLLERGCPKINLQIRSSNSGVIDFYRKLGYAADEVVSFGKRLIHDAPPDPDSTPPSAPGRAGN